MAALARRSSRIGRPRHTPNTSAVRVVRAAQRHDIDNNPLLPKSWNSATGLPPFARVSATDVVPAVSNMLEAYQNDISTAERIAEEILASTSGDADANVERANRVLSCLDESPIEVTWSAVSHLMGVKHTPELFAANNACLPDLIAVSSKASQSTSVYNALHKIRNQSTDALSVEQVRALDGKLLSAELSGVALPADQRTEFNEIQSKLAQLGSEFNKNVLDASKENALDLDSASAALVMKMPVSVRSFAAQMAQHAGHSEATAESGPWRFTLDAPSYVPFMTHCPDRELRQEMHRNFTTRASSGDSTNNTPIILQTLKLRAAKAKLLGYATYADVSLASKMAESTAAVRSLQSDIFQPARVAALRDLAEVTALASSASIESDRVVDGDLQAFDFAYWGHKLEVAKYDIDQEALKQYFPISAVMSGLFDVVEKLFGVSVTRVHDPKLVSLLWHHDAMLFDLKDGNQTIASFTLDPYSRSDKRGGAWMSGARDRRCSVRSSNGAEYVSQRPIAHMVCNGSAPIAGKESVMSFTDVTTLFHEFGHALQHMLTTSRVPSVTGINGIEWDAVELPSQFMENWCYHKPTLRKLSRHADTGESLSDAMIDKIINAKNLFSGSMALRQLSFGTLDLDLHDTATPPTTAEELFAMQKDVMSRHAVLPLVPYDRFLCSFMHIFGGGYAAGYYSYKWAEVLSADAFSAFEEAGLDDDAALQSTGRRFRNTVLAKGGSMHPSQVFHLFRGRDPRADALMRHTGLDQKNVAFK